MPLRNIDMGSMWELFREQYPNVEEQAPLTSTFETFGLPVPAHPAPQLTLVSEAEVLRYWFVTLDGTELFQIQPDRLIHNWRKHVPMASYPRYEPLKERFAAEAKKAQDFCIARGWGSIKPNQCEVSYINHISFEGDTVPEARLGEVFTIWSETYSDAYLKRIERGHFGLSYLLRSESEEPFGRLHVSAQPAILLSTSERIIRFALTARGKPQAEDIESAMKWLDLGRGAVVRAFASLTRKEMHDRWRRIDVN
jgi:uncharacterized protein (TIGR04255 family)